MKRERRAGRVDLSRAATNLRYQSCRLILATEIHQLTSVCYRASPISDVALTTLSNCLALFAVVGIIGLHFIDINAKRAAEAKLTSTQKDALEAL